MCEIYAENPHSGPETKPGCLKPSLLSVMKAFLDMKQGPLFPLFMWQEVQRRFQNLTTWEKPLSTMPVVWATLPFLTLTCETERQLQGGTIMQTRPELQPRSRPHTHTYYRVEPTGPVDVP